MPYLRKLVCGVLVLCGTHMGGWVARAKEVSAPVLQIADQQSDGGAIRIAMASVPESGWVVVHSITRNQAGDTSRIIGHSFIAGEQLELTIALSEPLLAGQYLIVALHKDEGVAGKLEFDRSSSFIDDIFIVDGRPIAAIITTSNADKDDEGNG